MNPSILGHYAAVEAMERYKTLMQEREKLHEAWHLKKIHLDQLCDLHIFLREAKLIEDATNAQETALNNNEFGETIDEITDQLRKHEAFEKVIHLQDKNLEALITSGKKLLNQNHFDCDQISSRLEEITAKRSKIPQLCALRRQLLTNNLLYAEFERDCSEALSWIQGKQKKLNAEVKTGEGVNLEEKIKKLQKHQAFQAEVFANLGKIQEVKHNGETLIRKNHKAAQDIADQLFDLDQAWKRLIDEIKHREKALAEAQDILEFNNQLDKIESWIRDKEVMIRTGDTGRDYEHCLSLQRKLDDVDSDMKIDSTKIKTISGLAQKLAKQGHPGVRERQEKFIDRWQALQGSLTEYRMKLAAALEMHLFDRDVADTSERLTEKCIAMESDDIGKDLASVEALQRRQEALESEIVAVENKIINGHQKDALLLSEKYPKSSDHLENKLVTLENQLAKLYSSRDKRRNLLQNAYEKEKFLWEVKELEQWVMDTITRMDSYGKPNSMTEAEAQLELHGELKAEINGRDEHFKNLIQYGKTCQQKDDPMIIENVEILEELHEKIHKAWDEKKQSLTNVFDTQDFIEQINQFNNWLASKEAILNNDDVGETPRAVEELLRKHNDFESMLENQILKINDLEKLANDLMNDTTKDNDEVTNKLNAIISRKDRLLQKTKERRDILEKSKALQEFLRNVNDVELWLSQKLQIAADENYREPVNLQNKIQKHTTFQAEIFASGERIQNVVEEGKELIVANHYAAREISIRLDELENDWKHLLELSNLKGDRLNEAYQALLFNRSLEEFEIWLTEVESHIKGTDTGKDLASANNLLKRHAVLENDIQQHTENCENIHEGAEQFVKGGHFMANEIEPRAQSAITRFHQLKQPLEARKDLLESSLMLHQFTRNVDDELQWVDEREPLVSSQDLGDSLMAVQILQKKQQVLEAELASREPIVASLVDRAQHLARLDHPSTAVIIQKAEELSNKLTHIRDLSSIRRLRLQDSFEAQRVGII